MPLARPDPPLVPALPDGVLPNPVTGELVNVGEPAAAARAVAEVKALERKLREFRGHAERILIEESVRLGTKTLRIGDIKVTVSGGSDVSYDVLILQELLDAGLPQERYDQAVEMVVEYKPKPGELKRIAAANEDYAAIIDRARVTVAKSSYLKVEGA